MISLQDVLLLYKRQLSLVKKSRWFLASGLAPPNASRESART
jgi:hypothetical protein